MKANPIKSVSIKFEYRNNSDLPHILKQLHAELKSDVMGIKSSIKGFEYSISVFNHKYMNASHALSPIQEEINGIECLVYKSIAWDDVTKKQIDNLKLK